MIVLTEATYELAMRVLRDAPPTVERHAAISALKLAMIQGITRELQTANGDLPALLRPQAH